MCVVGGGGGGATYLKQTFPHPDTVVNDFHVVLATTKNKRQQEPIPNPFALQLRFQTNTETVRVAETFHNENSGEKKKKKTDTHYMCGLFEHANWKITRANATCGSVNIVSRAC